MEVIGNFAKVCRKWDLPKDDRTQQLFSCFYDIAYFIHFGQYEVIQYGFLEAAQLIKLLKHGSKLKVTSAEGGLVSLDNPMLREGLYMRLNYELQELSLGLYMNHGIITEKEPKGKSASGWMFDCDKFVEPYTDEELQNIIDFEKKWKEFEGSLSPVKRLGHFVQRFLIEAPKVFGYFYCHVQSDGQELKPLLPPTKQFNIIGDLLQAAGVLREYKGELWLQDKWENMNSSERRHTLQDWLKSFENLQSKWWHGEESDIIFLPCSFIHRQEGKMLFGLESEIVAAEFSKLDF